MKQLIFVMLLLSISLASGSSEWVTLWVPQSHPVVKPPERVDVQFRLFVEHLGLIESSNRWQVVNDIGCMGKYQFTQATLELLGYHNITPERFRADPSVFPEVMQERALKDLIAHNGEQRAQMSDMARRDHVVAFADEPLRTVVDRMAETGYTRMPVVENSENRKIVGMVSLEDLLRARTRNLAEERSRECILRIRLPFRGGKGPASEAKLEL